MIRNPADIILKEIDSPEAHIILRRDNIVHVHYKKDVTLDVPLQLKMRDMYIELIGDKPLRFVFSADEGVSVTREATENARNIRSNSPISAYAIVVNILAYRIVANFFLKMYSPAVPFRLFKTYDEAIRWLHALEL